MIPCYPLSPCVSDMSVVQMVSDARTCRATHFSLTHYLIHNIQCRPKLVDIIVFFHQGDRHLYLFLIVWSFIGFFLGLWEKLLFLRVLSPEKNWKPDGKTMNFFCNNTYQKHHLLNYDYKKKTTTKNNPPQKKQTMMDASTFDSQTLN